MADLLFSCSTLQAPDPRDKILALQGLSGGESGPNLVSDYQLSTAQVYQDAARDLLQQHIIGTLSLVGIGCSSLKDLRSWVLDWRWGSVNSFCSIEKKLAYRASRETRPNIRADESLRTLVFAGYRLDKITTLGTDFNFRKAGIDNVDTTKTRWQEAAGDMAKASSHDLYRDGEPLSEALWRTLIGDQTRTERPAPASFDLISRHV